MDVKQQPSEGESGFSLIEIVIALGLFSLISLAGVVLVSSILQVRDRTEGRLEELGDLQRGLMMITSDFQQADGGSLNLTASGAAVERRLGGATGAVKYVLADGKVLRTLSTGGASGAQQTVLENVAAARWRVLLSDGGWVDAWPSMSGAGDEASGPAAPIALAVDLDLGKARAGISGTLRRVVELTAKP